LSVKGHTRGYAYISAATDTNLVWETAPAAASIPIWSNGTRLESSSPSFHCTAGDLLINRIRVALAAYDRQDWAVAAFRETPDAGG